jgi:hypothetical protein
VNARNSLTRTLSPPRQLFVELHSATTGAVLQRATADASGAYTFSALSDGSYFVYAGEDADGDGRVGEPGRRWGSAGGTSNPATVTVDGSGSYPASFTLGIPMEQEDNNSAAAASVLAIGGYITGTIGPESDVDVFTVLVSEQGAYTFETSAIGGACGFALEEDTVLELFDASGARIAIHDDIDEAAGKYCSRITTTLTTGRYYLRVTGYFGGRYNLAARSGS